MKKNGGKEDELETKLFHVQFSLLVGSQNTHTPITRPILLKAAALRAAHGFRTPDAIIIATALLGRATLLVTNDKKWKRVNELTVACLDDYR